MTVHRKKDEDSDCVNGNKVKGYGSIGQVWPAQKPPEAKKQRKREQGHQDGQAQFKEVVAQLGPPALGIGGVHLSD